jgi:hypothetical protein
MSALIFFMKPLEEKHQDGKMMLFIVSQLFSLSRRGINLTHHQSKIILSKRKLCV